VVHFGQLGHTVETIWKELAHHVCFYQPDKSAVRECGVERGHRLNFDVMTALARTTGYMNHLVKEVIEI
jgi:hypothetical protein